MKISRYQISQNSDLGRLETNRYVTFSNRIALGLYLKNSDYIMAIHLYANN